jgi:hypothetical protein
MSLLRVLAESLMITGFVFVMMLLVEYLNVLSAGVIRSWIQKKGVWGHASVILVGTAPGA